MKQEFWLYRWMDEYGVLRSSDISRLIRPGTRQVARLEEICHEVHMAPPAVQPSAGVNVLAGRGMDLSRDLVLQPGFVM